MSVAGLIHQRFYNTERQTHIKHSGFAEESNPAPVCRERCALTLSFCPSGSGSHVVPDVSDGERCGDAVSGAGAVSAAELHQQHRHVLRGGGGPPLLTPRYTTSAHIYKIYFLF